MKESISATFLFQIVIAFILLFTGIMCLTINHTKAFAVKDAVLQYIENEGGTLINSGSLDEGIKQIITDNGYFTTGNCYAGEDESTFTYHAFQRDGSIANGTNDAAICIAAISINQTEFLEGQIGGNTFLPEDASRGCYYKVKVFYTLSVPIIGSLFNFNVAGQTKNLYASNTTIIDYCAENGAG